MTPDSITDDDIRKARESGMIDRDTYEAAMYGGSEALAIVCSAINARRRRDWVEAETP